MKKIIVILISFVAAACAKLTVFPLTDGQVSNADLSTYGYLIGSITFSGAYPKSNREMIDLGRENYRFSKYDFIFQGLDEGNSDIRGSVSPIPENHSQQYTKDDGDFAVKQGRGYVFAVPVPAGNYEFYSYFYEADLTKYTPQKDFKLHFEVEPGKATYVGSINFDHQFGIGLLDMPFVKGANISFSNDMQRDVKLLKDKYTELQSVPVFPYLLSRR
ncbi:hypothetical protein [Microbulbifer sp. SAOS-129_SWC]|uniref:hypothetical protein n=1 Tax=Microbulbifer sp. SAOS-129_SWC TaxID=3145235 RepID=UPI003217FB29